MQTVIRREFKGDKVRDLPATIEEAEKIIGRKLDHRKKYAIIKRQVCELITWTQTCSGCSCDGEYPCVCCSERGAGCSWCGYTGKKTWSQWIPLPLKEDNENLVKDF